MEAYGRGKTIQGIEHGLKEPSHLQLQKFRRYGSGSLLPQLCDWAECPRLAPTFRLSDRTKGGHVLAVAIKLAEAEIDTTAQWTIDLPEKSTPFAGLKLETDLAKETKEVGTKH